MRRNWDFREWIEVTNRDGTINLERDNGETPIKGSNRLDFPS